MLFVYVVWFGLVILDQFAIVASPWKNVLWLHPPLRCIQPMISWWEDSQVIGQVTSIYVAKLGGGVLDIFGFFIPKFGVSWSNLTSIFFKWVETINYWTKVPPKKGRFQQEKGGSCLPSKPHFWGVSQLLVFGGVNCFLWFHAKWYYRDAFARVRKCACIIYSIHIHSIHMCIYIYISFNQNYTHMTESTGHKKIAIYHSQPKNVSKKNQEVQEKWYLLGGCFAYPRKGFSTKNSLPMAPSRPL